MKPASNIGTMKVTVTRIMSSAEMIGKIASCVSERSTPQLAFTSAQLLANLDPNMHTPSSVSQPSALPAADPGSLARAPIVASLGTHRSPHPQTSLPCSCACLAVVLLSPLRSPCALWFYSGPLEAIAQNRLRLPS